LECASLQGVGGIVELAPGYLPAAYKMVREAGGLCIADEVQAGVARTGSHFWGFEGQGVIPDIVTMAKVNNFSTTLIVGFIRSMIPRCGQLTPVCNESNYSLTCSCHSC
jgi:4-aminobutyrate aminotransferase-like enzyme